MSTIRATLTKNHADLDQNCSSPKITIGSSYTYYGGAICSSRDFATATISVNRDFSNGTKACVVWSGKYSDLKPCVTIHD